MEEWRVFNYMNKILLLFIIIIVLGVLGGAGYWWWSQENAIPSSVEQTQPTTPSSTVVQTTSPLPVRNCGSDVRATTDEGLQKSFNDVASCFYSQVPTCAPVTARTPHNPMGLRFKYTIESSVVGGCSLKISVLEYPTSTSAVQYFGGIAGKEMTCVIPTTAKHGELGTCKGSLQNFITEKLQTLGPNFLSSFIGPLLGFGKFEINTSIKL